MALKVSCEQYTRSAFETKSGKKTSLLRNDSCSCKIMLRSVETNFKLQFENRIEITRSCLSAVLLCLREVPNFIILEWVWGCVRLKPLILQDIGPEVEEKVNESSKSSTIQIIRQLRADSIYMSSCPRLPDYDHANWS